jgi:hypothetical protein
MPTDTEILDWIENFHSLHYSLEFCYVVDGYETEMLRDGNHVATAHGKTLRESIVKVMTECPLPKDHPMRRRNR